MTAGGHLDMGTEARPSGTSAHLGLAYGSGFTRHGLTIENGGDFTVRGTTKSPWGFAVDDFGEEQERWVGLQDITWTERAAAAVLTIAIIFMGLWPAPFLDRISPTIEAIPGLTL